MYFSQLLRAAQLVTHPWDPEWDCLRVRGLCTDSRQVRPGDLFLGMPGSRVDGGDFWQQAVAGGAVAVVTARPLAASESAGVPYVVVAREEIARACAEISAAFYHFPGRSLSLIGVTGTNGKTTTTHLIEYLLQAAGQHPALLGTLYNRWRGFSQVAPHTTAFAPELQGLLAQARDAGCRYAVLEISSHSLAQERVWGCECDVAVWTNLTQDHLDFHGTMEAYWQAKATLFTSDYLKGRAIINADDPGGQQLLSQWSTLHPGTDLEPWTYGLAGEATLRVTAAAFDARGSVATVDTPLGRMEIQVPLPGRYNLANALAAVGTALHLGIDPETISAALPHFPGVPGRMESVRLTPEQEVTVIVDYAHTPDGLENLLQAVRPLTQGRLICVFGCGGDRDRSKRPQMGRIAARWADYVLVTSDNPRTEDPQAILADIVAGMQGTTTPYQVQGDRAEAIWAAILDAQPGDTVVIAGKGHEDYQIIGREKIHFDDREVARAALRQRLQL
ncbi:MAG: UDP-N-acetylmuramoyl-L-alanyl-D-glutamate--2,6-diaminopimelate ligase [Thermostichales cyanobacterium SZTDM-1c_bins_54]